jgi:Ni/Co efflux regulator RcnB
MRKTIVSSVLALSLLVTPVFAGNPGQADQAGQSTQAGQHAGQCGNHHKTGFWKKVKKTTKKVVKKTVKAVKKGYKAGKKAAVKTGDCIQNKVMDSGVAIKKAVTGKKCKTFVKGHYDKNGKHTKGHFRKVGKGCCKK